MQLLIKRKAADIFLLQIFRMIRSPFLEKGIGFFVLFSLSDLKNRVAAVCVTQNFFIRQGLGREPQQAEKYTRSAIAARVIFRVCGNKGITGIVIGVSVFMI